MMMKRIFTLILTILLFSASTIAQNETDSLDNTLNQIELTTGPKGLKVDVHSYDTLTGEVKDTTKIKFENSTVYIVNEKNFEKTQEEEDEELDRERKKKLTHFSGIDIGFNGYLNADNELDLGKDLDEFELKTAGSRSFAINILEYKARIAKDYFGLTTGLGFEWNSYKFKNNYTLSTTKDTITAFMDTTISISKNKFRTSWVNIPLMLEFNTSLDPERSFHLGAGVVGGLNLGNMYKQKFSRDGQDFKSKTRNDFNVAPWRLEAMLRLGYGSLNLFAKYQLTELFDDGEGPELYPFTVGITLLAFD